MTGLAISTAGVRWIAAMKPSVVLVREWEQQMSGSGCCGRLEGDVLGGAGGERVFAERRAIMEAMGPLYRRLRGRFGDDLDLLVVDPRNQISLIPRLVRDFRRYGVGWREAARTLRDLSTSTVVVNGRLFARGAWPPAEAVIVHIERLAETDGPEHAAV